MKNTYARGIVLVHDTSSQCALQMYEVSLKYLSRLSSSFCTDCTILLYFQSSSTAAKDDDPTDLLKYLVEMERQRQTKQVN